MNKDSNILAEKYEVIKFKGRPKDDKVEDVDYIDVDAKEVQDDKVGFFDIKKSPILKKAKENWPSIKDLGAAYGTYKAGKDYFDKRSKAASDAKNTSRLYATEFLKGEQSYQDLNNRYGIDETQMYDLLKKARIPVTAFGMYKGKGSGIDVYKDYINKYKPAPMQKLGRGIKSFANYFRGKKKPEA